MDNSVLMLDVLWTQLCGSDTHKLQELSARLRHVDYSYCELSISGRDRRANAVVQGLGFAQVFSVFVQLSEGFGKADELVSDGQLEKIQKVGRHTCIQQGHRSILIQYRQATLVEYFSCCPWLLRNVPWLGLLPV